MKLQYLNESKARVSDNEVTFLKHHIEDAIKALESNNMEVLKSSLEDLKELIDQFESRFSPGERKEL